MASPDPDSPRMLGRYALYERIASGGMASVHIGRLLGPVGFARTVAIKRMHPQFAEDPEFVSMFLDEARLAARIRHPNVVPTLDVVATGGDLFLVMDYVEGESLSRLIRAASVRGERIAPEMVASIMVGTLHGLHAAHEAKSDYGEPLDIVHRDVSPQNILIGRDGVARVLDFGVAKALGRLQTTRGGQLKGKLAYMPPEQVRGELSRLTDVYAASVVLWEALTGRRLFHGDNDAQVFDRVLKGCSEPPSRYTEGLPAALDAITMRGLSVDPQKRFPTARDMARALEESIALAPASRIGDWVEEVAKATLDQRSARVASIESNSSVRSVPDSADKQKASRSDKSAEAADDVLVPIIEGTSTQLSSGSVSSPGQRSLLGARRRRAWVLVTLGAIAFVSAMVLTFRQHSTRSSVEASMAPTPPPAASSSAFGGQSGHPRGAARSSFPRRERVEHPIVEHRESSVGRDRDERTCPRCGSRGKADDAKCSAPSTETGVQADQDVGQ